MKKAQVTQEATGKWVVRDSRTGQLFEVRGANSQSATALAIKKGVDLTKPIAQQVLNDGFDPATRSPGGPPTSNKTSKAQ